MRYKILYIAVIIVIIAFVSAILMPKRKKTFPNPYESNAADCSIKKEIVNGKIIEKNFFGCNSGEIGDKIILNQKDSVRNAAKELYIVAKQGDKLSLQALDADKFNILVNGEILKNSQGNPFRLYNLKFGRLAMLIRDTFTVPKGIYLYSDGNELPQQASSFGIIPKTFILGRVVEK